MNNTAALISLEPSVVSDREKEVLILISYGYSMKEVASELFVSYHTINSHRKNLMNKLEARNIASLIRKGFELGILY